ncbi:MULTISPECIES: DUF4126 domain-containing protein [unclassified Kitasatospora]|uniref:DUF4126 domain-containing protein n=1 Tax=unclassified Kitasatospora TaxID=2633591 RepID=UPI00070C61FF|nr:MULTISPECIES: DUF4126 domain-containing protein [unclassified Kitasatospora]KQV16876.1 hypothetical protein ASC99_27325 [Kitasatospora sp. Root107]KRB73680.1 hypothetical protein ASE03_21005 [Kitasatospora sp. Root187]
MSVVPLVFTSGWASGINAYAVVLLLGLLGRFGGADSVPPTLERTDVLIAATVLFLCEAVADKIPYVDSVWDVIHTVIRPIAGATIGALLASQDPGSLGEVAAGAMGGTTALISHGIKASLRMAINTSPEPASNIVASITEDLSVAGLVTLAIFHPWLAASAAAVLILVGALLVWFAISRIRRFIVRRRERRAGRAAAHQPAQGATRVPY